MHRIDLTEIGFDKLRRGEKIKTDDVEISYLDIRPLKKGTKTMKTYKPKGYIHKDKVVAKLPDCVEALRLFKSWIEADQKGITTSKWLNENPKAGDWAVKNGFAVPLEEKHDWSGLKLTFDENGSANLWDSNTNMGLLSFMSSGQVYAHSCANSTTSAGNFDHEGRLIVSTRIS